MHRCVARWRCCLAIGLRPARGWHARYALRAALVDQPGERRAHATPTPRGGGIAHRRRAAGRGVRWLLRAARADRLRLAARSSAWCWSRRRAGSTTIGRLSPVAAPGGARGWPRSLLAVGTWHGHRRPLAAPSRHSCWRSALTQRLELHGRHQRPGRDARPLLCALAIGLACVPGRLVVAAGLRAGRGDARLPAVQLPAGADLPRRRRQRGARDSCWPRCCVGGRRHARRPARGVVLLPLSAFVIDATLDACCGACCAGSAGGSRIAQHPLPALGASHRASHATVTLVYAAWTAGRASS